MSLPLNLNDKRSMKEVAVKEIAVIDPFMALYVETKNIMAANAATM
jgi:hypothetical protein